MEDLYTLSPSRAAEAQEYNRQVRLLAQSGKSNFKRFVYDPLFRAAWERRAGDAQKTLDHLRNEVKNPAYRTTLGPNCKRMVGSAMAENFSILGDTVLFFLEVIQMLPQVGEAREAVEFLAILKAPLAEWQRLNSERSAGRFEQALTSLEESRIAEALEPVKLGANSERGRITGEIQRLYQQILIASRSDNFKRAAQLLSRYMMEYSDTEDYAEKDVRKVIDAMKARDPGFEDFLNQLLANDLYFRISQGIMKGDLKVAVRMIRKYAMIFEGNASIRYYYEIDRLERMLYNVISRKDLWKTMKRA
jgi:hypothetical protein